MAIKVYRANSKISVKIGDAVFKLSPFTQEQKIELMQFVSMDGGSRIENLAKMSFMACKFAIKEVSGIVYEDGSEFKLEVDEKGVTDKCLSELMNTEINQELLASCQALLQGVPKEILNPVNQKKFDNVEILSDSSIPKKSLAQESLTP